MITINFMLKLFYVKISRMSNRCDTFICCNGDNFFVCSTIYIPTFLCDTSDVDEEN